MKLFTSGIVCYAEVLQNRKDLPWLLMLHGFMGSGEIFQPLFGRLKSFCNPVLVDLPGHGRSSGSTDPERYHTKHQVSDLRSILDRLQLSPLFLYGYSMGGRLALQFALEHSQHVNALILESSGCGLSDPEERRERARLDEERAGRIESDYPGFLEQWMRLPLFTGTASETRASNEEWKGLYRQVMEKQNRSHMAASLRGFGSGTMPPARERLEKLDIPVLLLSGESDPKYAHLHREMAAQLPRATAHNIAGAAHRVHMDQTDSFIRKLKTFIQQP